MMAKKGLVLGLVVMVMVLVAVAVLPVLAQEGGEAASTAADASSSITGSASAEQIKQQSFLSLIVWSSGTIGFTIIGISVVAMALVFRAIFTLRPSELMPSEVQQQLDGFLREKRIKEAMDYCRSDNTLLSKVVGAGLSEIRNGYDEMKTIMSEVADEEALKLHQQVNQFSLIANIAPMLGLFGTVWGMMLTFKAIASSGGMAKPAEMAYGIMQALVTTFEGLMVAIPCIAIFTFLKNRLTRMLVELGVVVGELTGRFKTMSIQSGSTGGTGTQLPSQTRTTAAAPGAAPARPAAPPAGPPPAAPAAP